MAEDALGDVLAVVLAVGLAVGLEVGLEVGGANRATPAAAMPIPVRKMKRRKTASHCPWSRVPGCSSFIQTATVF